MGERNASTAGRGARITRSLSVLLFLLASCGHPPTPEECKALLNPMAIKQRCFGGTISPSSNNYIGDLKCFPYSKPQRLHGLWVLDLEMSEFYPNASSMKETTGQSMILDSDLIDKRPELLAAEQGAGRRVFAVEFEGRTPLCKGERIEWLYPKVIVERFYSMRLLPSG